MLSAQNLNNSAGRRLLDSFLRDELGNNKAIDIFDKLTYLYFQVNSVINISALRNIDDVYIKHYLDSIYPYKYFDGSCCDVGCGGGFPCLPLAIVTGLDFTGVDSVGKKLTLIRRCVSELNIKNIKAEYSRSEDLTKLNRSYTTVCARALADVDKALCYCAPLTAKSGKIVLYRTQNDSPAKPSSEKKYGVELAEAIDYTLPNTDIKRRLFIYKK